LKRNLINPIGIEAWVEPTGASVYFWTVFDPRRIAGSLRIRS
jgi:hypothetical protein